MEQKQLFGGLVYDQLPPLCANYTWLVAQTPEEQIFYTIEGQSNYRCRVPELLGARIRGCFHGWVILSSNNDVSWSLWNPVTSKIIHLLPLILRDRDYSSIGQCCLSSPPDEQGSILLFTRTTKPTFVFCRLNCKYNNKLRWLEMSYCRVLKKITGFGFDRLLSCPSSFNGRVYALCDKQYVIRVDIVSKPYGEEIELLIFGRTPYVNANRCYGLICLLKGYGTELFYIGVAFDEVTNKTLRNVYLFKWVMTSTRWNELKETDRESSKIGYDMWEEMVNLKDAVFLVNLACDTVFYMDAIASEFGGYIHIIRDEMGKMIYSYNVQDNTVSPSYMRFQPSHLSLWECRLVIDPGEAKCTHNYKHETYKDSKIMVRSVKDDEAESRVNSLPFHILEIISELCVGVEYMHFRATCKQFSLVAPVIRWSNKATIRRLQSYSVLSPWLMVVDKSRGIVSFTDPILGDKYFMKTCGGVLEIHLDQIFCSSFGWLLYYTALHVDLVLFNPFTNEIHNLPCMIGHYPWGRLPHLRNVCFSAPPTSLDCTVVGFSFLAPSMRVYIHRVAKDQKWHMLPLNLDGVDPFSICFPTFFNGDIYVLCNKGELYVLKYLQDYSWNKIVDVGGRSGRFFLVKSDQNLLLVIVSNKYFGESVDVFKLNMYKKEWEKIDCLGRQMIYICESSCISVEAMTPEMENKIYFPRFNDSKNGKIVFYSLETRKFHTFNEHKFIRDNLSMGVEHLNPHLWIQPSWS